MCFSLSAALPLAQHLLSSMAKCILLENCASAKERHKHLNSGQSERSPEKIGKDGRLDWNVSLRGETK